VHASLLCGYATSGIVNEHHFEEVESAFIKVCAEMLGHVALPFGERRFEVGEAGLVCYAWPVGFGGGT
jgi:hypothetical protein